MKTRVTPHKLIVLAVVICVLTAAWFYGGNCMEKAALQDHVSAVKKTDNIHTCILSVNCSNILGNLDQFNQDKLEVLPPGGVIFPTAKVSFYKGDSVFDVLQRSMKKAGIQMEFESIPVYDSNYIEGIGNIYEFDCGELSGWMYKVNGKFPNYGCSRFKIKENDVIEWVYTCNLGRDVGGDYASNGGRGL